MLTEPSCYLLATQQQLSSGWESNRLPCCSELALLRQGGQVRCDSGAVSGASATMAAAQARRQRIQGEKHQVFHRKLGVHSFSGIIVRNDSASSASIHPLSQQSYKEKTRRTKCSGSQVKMCCMKKRVSNHQQSRKMKTKN
ncbi:uncharacterized protein RBU33_019416 [Hipposideros larvatus]